MVIFSVNIFLFLLLLSVHVLGQKPNYNVDVKFSQDCSQHHNTTNLNVSKGRLTKNGKLMF